MKTQSKARGPASIGNCAAGFDVLGHSFAGPNDVVTVSLREDSDIVITDIRCGDAELPTDPERNTASRAVLELRRLAGANQMGFSIEIDKGIPLASGMGGSAASAVAAVVATNHLLPTPQPTKTLYAAACAGEAAASGAPHGDNVAPSLLGGLVSAVLGEYWRQDELNAQMEAGSAQNLPVDAAAQLIRLSVCRTSSTKCL